MTFLPAAIRRTGGLAMAAAVSLALVACDNPVEVEDEHVVGIVLVDAADAQVASYTVGGGATGALEVEAGGSTTFRVFALSDEGERIPIDGTELELRTVAVSGSVASVTLEAGPALRMEGIVAGDATLTAELWHGGHEEFRATVPVRVR